MGLTLLVQRVFTRQQDLAEDFHFFLIFTFTSTADEWHLLKCDVTNQYPLEGAKGVELQGLGVCNSFTTDRSTLRAGSRCAIASLEMLHPSQWIDQQRPAPLLPSDWLFP